MDLLIYGVLALILFLSFIIGLKSEKEENFENLLFFLTVLVFSYFLSIPTEYYLNFKLLFINKSISDIFFEIINSVGEYQSIIDYSINFEESVYQYFVSISKGFFFSFFVSLFYFVSYFKRFFTLIFSKDKRKNKNIAGGFLYLLEIFLVISVVLTPFSKIHNIYLEANIVLAGEDSNLCESFDGLNEFEKYCDVVDESSATKILIANEYNKIFGALINNVSDDKNTDLKSDILAIDQLIEGVKESNAIIIITDDEFSFLNLEESNIDFIKLIPYLEPAFESKLLNPFLVDVVNNILEGIGERVKENYSTLNIESLMYGREEIIDDYSIILELIDFAIEYRLIELVRNLNGSISLSSIANYVGNRISSGEFDLLKIVEQVKNLEKIDFVESINESIDVSNDILEIIISQFSKSIISIMYIASMLLTEMDGWISDFRSSELYLLIKKVLLK